MLIRLSGSFWSCSGCINSLLVPYLLALDTYKYVKSCITRFVFIVLGQLPHTNINKSCHKAECLKVKQSKIYSCLDDVSLAPVSCYASTEPPLPVDLITSSIHMNSIHTIRTILCLLALEHQMNLPKRHPSSIPMGPNLPHSVSLFLQYYSYLFLEAGMSRTFY